MKNMKKLLGAITALGFVSASAVSVIACGGSSNTSNHKGNLASLTAIDTPGSFKINGNIKTVSASDLKDALAPVILTAVEKISRPGVLTKDYDYDYQLFTDEEGGSELTTTSDLTKNIDIFVKITATEQTTILKPGSSTKVIQFTLPAANNLVAITSIDTPANFNINGNIKTVNADDLKDALAPIILTAVENISQSGVTKDTDYDYQLFSDEEGGSELTTTSDLTKNIDIFVKITATGQTTILNPGSSTKVIKFTLPAANNLAAITSIDAPVAGAFVVFSPTETVTKSDIVTALTSDILKKIRAINTSATSLIDVNLVVAEAPGGSEVSKFDFSEKKPIYVTITPASDSDVLTGTTGPIRVDMPFATANLSGITSANQFGTLTKADFPAGVNKSYVRKDDIIAAIAAIENNPNKPPGMPTLKISLSYYNKKISDITTDITWEILTAVGVGKEDMAIGDQGVDLSGVKNAKVYITLTPAVGSTLFAGSSDDNIEVPLPDLV